MRIVAVDDEKLILDGLCKCIREVSQDAELTAFTSAEEALEYTKENDVDVVFLDIQMEDISGMELAKQIKMLHPEVNIIFCTGYSEHIYDAVTEIRCSGYLLKPATAEKVKEELENLRNPVEPDKSVSVYVQCFGNFEVFANGVPVPFELAKSKELMAYLVDRKGAVCSNRELEAALWEDDLDHSSYLKKCKRLLLKSLKEADCADIIHSQWGGLSIVPDRFSCDYYEWEKGTAAGINAYKGQYMAQYSWAEMTNGQLGGI